MGKNSKRPSGSTTAQITEMYQIIEILEQRYKSIGLIPKDSDIIKKCFELLRCMTTDTRESDIRFSDYDKQLKNLKVVLGITL